MKILTQDVKMVCEHKGTVSINPGQNYVSVNGRLILIDDDPEKRIISGCSNGDPLGISGTKSCTRTLKVKQGYSTWIRIDGKGVCLDSLTGITDGTPPGLVKYLIEDPGQGFVSGAEE